MDKTRFDLLAPWFDPYKPADATLYVERADNPSRELEQSRVGPRQKHGLLIGATGSGKSTEIERLAISLREEEDPPVVGILRLQLQCDPDKLSAAQVLFLVGVTTLRLAEAKPPGKLVRELEQAYRGIVESTPNGSIDVMDLISRLLVLAGGIAGTAQPRLKVLFSAGAAASGALKDIPRLPLPGRGLPLEANDASVTRLAEAVNECLSWTRDQYQGAHLALFVDGLDKIPNPDIVESLFSSGVLALPSEPVVFTAPISLRYDVLHQRLADQFSFLTVGNFRVFRREPDGAHDDEGFDRMRRILQRRFERAKVSPEQILEGGLEEGGLADRLIEASGGVTRTLISLFDSAMRLGRIGEGARREILSEEEIQEVIEARERDTVLSLTSKRPFLEPAFSVWSTQDPPSEEAHDLLFYNLVLCYSNHWPWFRPTPLLLRYLRERYPERCPR
jgi:hypothetical protein